MSERTIELTTATGGQIWMPTMELRFYTRARQSGPANAMGFAPHSEVKILEQKWVAQDGSEEWRDVPHSGVTKFVE